MKKAGLLILVLLFSNLALALDCPYGQVNDSQQLCGLYQDKNSDTICDLSQEIPAQTLPTLTNNVLGKTTYHTLEITIITTLIYLLSYLLVKKGKLQYPLHKKIWNYLLLVSFIIVALTSIGYLIKLDYNISTISLTTLNFWHIELGLIMILISLYHTLWHLRYYFNTEKIISFFYKTN